MGLIAEASQSVASVLRNSSWAPKVDLLIRCDILTSAETTRRSFKQMMVQSADSATRVSKVMSFQMVLPFLQRIRRFLMWHRYTLSCIDFTNIMYRVNRSRI